MGSEGMEGIVEYFHLSLQVRDLMLLVDIQKHDVEMICWGNIGQDN